MKRNPSKPKIKRQGANLSRVFETLKVDDFKTTLANFEYTHMLKRTWANFDSGATKKATR